MSSPVSAPSWRERFAQSGWALLPLRLFLGFTFLYAGLLKLTDKNYLDPASTSSVQSQMLNAIRHSPISWFVSHAFEHATLFGLAIAIGEVAAGLSLLLGLWTRLGALGGLLLSLSFFLTVSFSTSPYFYGPDIVFFFACIPLILAGDGGVWSLGASIKAAVYRDAKLPNKPIEQIAPADIAAVDRRVLLRTGAVAAIAGVIALAIGAVGRVMGGNSSGSTASGGSTPSASATTAKPTATATASATATSAVPAGAKKVATTSDVKVGSAFAFDAPDGTQAYMVQPAAGQYMAYSRVCTHQGCTVDFAGTEFACPCHGAQFSVDTGDVSAGPAPSPLQKFNVVAAGNDLYVV